MTYEIFLTDSCNRSCRFCYVKKGAHVASEGEIAEFSRFVKERQDGNLDRYDVNIFGGEPFASFTKVDSVFTKFRDDHRCTVHVVTNGELIEPWMCECLHGMHLHLSTYSIFDQDSQCRYLDLYRRFVKSTCLYTLTESDIDRFDEIKSIYGQMGVDYHIHMSHDPCSWSKFGVDELYSKVRKLMESELSEYSKRFSNSTPRGQDFIDQHLARYIGGICSDGEVFCTSGDKMTFYKGRFIGPCIRLDGVELDYRGVCGDCKYRNSCTRGCFAEICGRVDERLCAIEKARFDAVEEFLSTDPNAPQIIAFYRDLS